jgi:AbrB family transcriptional regulator, stage V sporulation protein T
MTHQAKIISGGKMVIPAEIRRSLGLKPGDRVEVRQEGEGRFVVRTYAQVVREIQDKYREMLKNPFTVDDFIAERRAEAAREDEAGRRS